MKIPRATYRLQFHEKFRLDDALALVPYLHDLGVSHIYASPLFAATPHSTHGYDVCDFEKLNPELGTEADLEKLADALHEKNMGLVLDIVPNHMGIGPPENVWWWDVLTHGEQSEFAGCFDIDWQPAEKNLRGKILVPVLGDQYQTLLNKGEFQLIKENGKFVLSYHEHRFPLAPGTVSKFPPDENGLKKFNSDFAALDALIQKQNYVLDYFGVGDSKLNYRRFFAVSSLAAVRVDVEDVFNRTHSLIKKWVERGWLDGLRVDHPDGLRDPQQYLGRLRAIAPNAWIVVEKILEPEEFLPVTWPVQGTTGYDFLNQLNGFFVAPAAEKLFTEFYAEFTGEPTDCIAVIHEKKRLVLKTLFISELNRLTHALVKVAARRQQGRSFGDAQFQEALEEIIVCFPVYRSYISEENDASAADRAATAAAMEQARGARPELPAELFAFIHGLFLRRQSSADARNFIARFQQLTGPVMAKGVEDTAFYCFNRFVSLNEVGGDPGRFGIGLEAFHNFLMRQKSDWPHSQLATSTHDTKRAEDVRARLNVLSEIPETWIETVRRWSKMNGGHRQNNFPDRNAEFLFYQMLAGAWPMSVERAQFYMEKAAHESKQHTTWTRRDETYENTLKDFVAKTLGNAEFIADLEKFVRGIAGAADVNSLAQTLVKLTAPGVPDIYQGCELLDLSTVDPDNRRPVDFKRRETLLAEIKNFSAEKIWARRAEGLAKLWLIQKTLKACGGIVNFTGLDYQPLFAAGPCVENVAAFSRGGKTITAVPRFTLAIKNEWRGTSLPLPGGSWREEFSGEIFSGAVRMENLFRKFPVALLVKGG